jgi:benzil reductase ((S)-benzoin forming)
MKYYIITETSDGLGESLAKRLIDVGNTLFCISRTLQPQLEDLAAERHALLRTRQFDLHQIDQIPSLMLMIMKDVNFREAEGMYLINNAEVEDPVTSVGQYNHADIRRSVHVNLIAPMVLSSAFIEQTTHAAVDKRILNISSSAAQKPYAGWGPYCSTKAGLDMFTRCAGLEQQTQQFPVIIAALASSILDPAVQQRIQKTEPEDLEAQRFVGHHQQDFLSDPNTIAAKVIDFLHRDDLAQGTIYDVRKLL